MKKVRVTELSYFLIMIGYIISLTNIPSHNTICNLMCILGGGIALFLVVLNNKYSLKNIALFVLVGIAIGISSRHTMNYQFLYTYVFILSATRINLDQLIKKDISVRIIVIVFIITASLLGLIDNRIDVVERGTRYSLGFAHPNNLGAMCMILAIYVFYSKHKNFRFIDYCFILFMDWVCYSIAISRTSSVIITLVLTVEIIDTFFSRFSGKSYWLDRLKDMLITVGQIFVIGIPLISIYFGMNYKTNMFYIGADKLLNSRLYLMYLAIKSNGITLFGQYVKTTAWTETNIASETNAIDNAYGYILVNFGVIVFVIVVLLLLFSYRYAMKSKQRNICLGILFFMAAGFCENKMFYIGSNLFTIYIAYSIFDYFAIKRKPLVRNM